MLTGGGWAVERTFALAAIEAGQVPASERDPDDIIAVDIHASRRKSPYLRLRIVPGHFVVLRQSCFRRIRSRIQGNHAPGKSQHAAPDHAVGTDPEAVERG